MPAVSTASRWALLIAVCTAFSATPASALTVNLGETIDVCDIPITCVVPASLGSLTMDGGLLRLSAGDAPLTLTVTDAILGRGMIFLISDYQKGGSTLSLLGTTQVPGAPVGPGVAAGMYLNSSYFDANPFPVINKGTLNQTGTGELTLVGQANLVNDTGALFSIQNDKGVALYTGSPSIGRFLNKGTLAKSGATGTSNILLPFDQEGGQVQLFSGILSFGHGGTHTSAAVLDADPGGTGHSGLIVFGGTTTFGDGTMLLGDVITTKAGNFSLAGNLVVADKTLWRQQGNFTAKFTGSIALTSGATLLNSGTLALQDTKSIAIGSGAILNNSGTLVLQNASRITIEGSATLENTGTLQLQNSSFVTIASGAKLQNGGALQVQDGANILGTGLLENTASGRFQGNILLSPTAGTTQLIDVRNEGLFNVGAANTVAVGALDNYAGTLTVDGRLDTYKELDLLGGVLAGTGTINGDLFVGGGPGTAIFTPGHSPGTMTINGNFSLLPGGVLQLELTYDEASGSVHWDFLTITGSVRLAGHIDFLVGPIDPDEAAVYSFFDCACTIDYGSTFTYDFPGRPGSQIALHPSGPRIVVLGEVAPVPEPQVYATMLAGLGVVGAVAMRRRRSRLSLPASS